jgi:hypothetical protein
VNLGHFQSFLDTRAGAIVSQFFRRRKRSRPEAQISKYLPDAICCALQFGEGFTHEPWHSTQPPTTPVSQNDVNVKATDEETAGGSTGTVSGPPPSVSSETSAAMKDEASKDSTGQSVAGQDKLGNADGQTVMGEAGKEKTAKESKEDSASS